MTRYLAAYAATAVIFLALDYVWLTRLATRFYADQLGELLSAKPNLGAAAAFYLIYVVGIVVFAVAPGLKANSGATALGFGALFGMLAYATYDITNYATLKNWPLTVSIVDISWGTFLTGTAALGGYVLVRQLYPT